MKKVLVGTLLATIATILLVTVCAVGIRTFGKEADVGVGLHIYNAYAEDKDVNVQVYFHRVRRRGGRSLQDIVAEETYRVPGNTTEHPVERWLWIRNAPPGIYQQGFINYYAGDFVGFSDSSRVPIRRFKPGGYFTIKRWTVGLGPYRIYVGPDSSLTLEQASEQPMSTAEVAY